MWIKMLFTFGIFVLTYGTIHGKRSIQTYLDLKESEIVLEKTINSLEDQNRNLQMEITKLKNSPSYAKKVLKDKYHLKDDDEKIIFFAD